MRGLDRKVHIYLRQGCNHIQNQLSGFQITDVVCHYFTFGLFLNRLCNSLCVVTE